MAHRRLLIERIEVNMQHFMQITFAESLAKDCLLLRISNSGWRRLIHLIVVIHTAHFRQLDGISGEVVINVNWLKPPLLFYSFKLLKHLITVRVTERSRRGKMIGDVSVSYGLVIPFVQLELTD